MYSMARDIRKAMIKNAATILNAPFSVIMAYMHSKENTVPYLLKPAQDQHFSVKKIAAVVYTAAIKY